MFDSNHWVYTQFFIMIKLDISETWSFDSNQFLHLIRIIFMVTNFVWFDLNQTLYMIRITLFFNVFSVRVVAFDLNTFLYKIQITWLMIQIILSQIRINWQIFKILLFFYSTIFPHLIQIDQSPFMLCILSLIRRESR